MHFPLPTKKDKKTDVIEIKTGIKLQIEIASASATATLNNTILKKEKKPFSNTEEVHRTLLTETGSAKRFSIVAISLLHREHFYTLATA